MERTYLLINLLLIYAIVSPYKIDKSYAYSQDYGEWQNMQYVNQDEDITRPSTHFACGWSTRQENWKVYIQNCECKKDRFNGYLRENCENCQIKLNTRTSGIKIIYCNYDNWEEQTSVVYQTSSPNAGNWRNITICPRQTFIRALYFKYGTQFTENLYFIGLAAVCSPLDFKNEYFVSDQLEFKKTSIRSASKGLLFSSFKIKSFPNGPLTGMKANFEYVPMVESITFKYDGITDQGIKPVCISRKILQNCGDKQSTFQLRIAEGQYKGIYQVNQNFIKSYKIKQKAISQIQFPRLRDIDHGDRSQYKIQTTSFRFGGEAITTLKNIEAKVIQVPSKFQKTLSQIIRIQQISVSFTAQVKIASIYNGKYIGTYVVSGKYTGISFSNPKLIIETQPAKECQINHNNQIILS